MSERWSELELEALPELESEAEWEGEFEEEYEGEEFLGRLAGLAGQALRSPALRRIGMTAARSALRRGLGGQRGGLGTQLSGLLGGLLGESEFESEGEWELEEELEGVGEEEYEWEASGEEEWEAEVNPMRRVYPDALMEHLGHAAAEAESEAEAEAFLGALIPLAAQILPRVAPTLARVAPQLIRGVTGVARTLRRSPATRPLIRAVPTVVRRTAANLARQVASGRPVTAQGAVRTLARQTAQVLGNPRQCACALRRSRTVDRRYHRAAPAARPAAPR